MEPLSPNDPLWNVLGKAKSVNPRPNFTQNVVRQARQTPQERGWLSHLRHWWQEHRMPRALAWTAVTAAVALGAAATFFNSAEQTSRPQIVLTAPVPSTSSAAAIHETAAAEVDFPLIPEFETEWKNLEQVGDLLAVHDTSLLTDSEINMLLY